MHQYDKINHNYVNHMEVVYYILSNINELLNLQVDNTLFNKNVLHKIFSFYIHHHIQILIYHYIILL